MAKADAHNSSSRGTTRRALVIVSVLALAGLAYAIARVDILRDRIVKQAIAMETVRQDNLTLRSRLETLATSSESSALQLTQLRSELAALSSNLGDLQTRAEQAQRISTYSEALYLLRLAHDQLRLARDRDGALDTLTATEALLRTSGDSALQDIQQQVLTHLGQLRALPRSEVARIQQQLGIAEQQAGSLRLAGITAASNADSELPAAGTARAWALLKRSMASLFIVRKTSIEASTLLSSDEQMMRRRHLQLLLLNARQATHLYDQTGYANALTDSIRWLDQVFDPTDPAVTTLRAQLGTLAQQHMAPPLPDLTASVAAMTQLAAQTGASAP